LRGCGQEAPIRDLRRLELAGLLQAHGLGEQRAQV
jgi:hypothetical protein